MAGKKNNRKLRQSVVYVDRMCAYCLVEPSTTADHVVPKRQGGLDRWFNLVGACSDCNKKKDDRTPKQAGMKMRLPKRFFEPKPSVLPQRPKTERGPEKFDIPTPRVLDSNRKLLGQSRKKDEMELKDGQKFREVAQGDAPGLPSFYGVEYVAQGDQTPKIKVSERMGIPDLSLVQIRVPGLGSEVGVPTLVVRGSIDILD